MRFGDLRHFDGGCSSLKSDVCLSPVPSPPGVAVVRGLVRSVDGEKKIFLICLKIGMRELFCSNVRTYLYVRFKTRTTFYE